MFSKILIANRGEIACRIIKTARRMGIRTVAVYSDADKRSLHVQMADEAIHIGPAPAAESYLVIEKIIDACKRSGAEAVHPGYGFLSERAAFADALKVAGIAFIGPNPGAMRAMGDKIESKKCASAAGVSTVPGYLGVIATPEEAVSIADEIGYPIMIKASAGGGGKGMRIAYSAAEVADGFARAKSEAASSFGDDRVFVEKFIVEPRHIEIQVLGDKHGNIIYLGERECSIQRRNQKVLEEAPSPLLDEDTRRRMGEQAVALARAVDYDSAGTVEFVCDQNKAFYFLEMNTRLQVEHPVTELITGIDLVEHMIRVAAGEVLTLAQDDIQLNGWAVESRIYAEDPTANFMPAAGRLTTYRPPAEGAHNGVTVRNDTGVYEGGEISINYDPMIAKLVSHAPTREKAIAAQALALDAFTIEGIPHNIPFVSALMHHPRWRSGQLSTAFIADEFPNGFSLQAPEGSLALRMAAVAATIEAQLSAQSLNGEQQSRRALVVLLNGTPYALTIDSQDDQWSVCFEEHQPSVTLAVATHWRPGQPAWLGSVGGEAVAMQVRPGADGFSLAHAGTHAQVMVLSPREAELLALMPSPQTTQRDTKLHCPMPAVVVAISAEVGQTVAAGDALCVVEAMKMEITLSAECDGRVSKINVSRGDVLAHDAVIMEFN